MTSYVGLCSSTLHHKPLQDMGRSGVYTCHSSAVSWVYCCESPLLLRLKVLTLWLYCLIFVLLISWQLALKLHPDKNFAARSEDAFKALTKAFSCLSDPDKVGSMSHSPSKSGINVLELAWQSAYSSEIKVHEFCVLIFIIHSSHWRVNWEHENDAGQNAEFGNMFCDCSISHQRKS
jgi:hypothetical protein